ncbi:MAG: hypothetical protein CBE35_02130 [Candidatus Pelagibacter sp. TMED275]|nr:MAG: hypothetical protein CBE35_02130 [Candidatus Pelagibacter sp. TMED275]
MAGYSARQSSYSDGDTITAAHTNDEFNQILAAFNVSTGHTHDGSTAGDGGPISKLFSNAITFGTGADTDIAITFDGNTSDGVLTWMEDEDYFQFSDDILLSTTEKLQFRDTAIYIHSSADGQLDLIADTEIQIAATTVDINGNVDVSGTLTVAGAVDFGDAALSNVGAVQLDSIAGDGDTDTSITFSGSDVITIAAGGANQVTFTNGAIVPSTDNDIDLGTSSVEFKDAFFDGTVTSDAFAGPLTGDVTGNVSGTAATVTGAAQSNITSLGTLTTLTVDDITINGSTISDGGDFTLDVNGDITLDANGGDILFKDDGTTFGSATNTSGNLIIKSGTTTALTFSGANVTVAGDLTISGDDLVMGTNTAGHILVADGTNFNPVAVGDLSEISTVANDDVFLAVDTSGGGLKKIARSAVVSGLASSAAISNVVEDTTPQLGGDLDVNGNDLVSTSNGNISLLPNGTGKVIIDGNGSSGGVSITDGLIDIRTGTGNVTKVKFYCESSNAHAQTLQAAPHSASSSAVLVLPTASGTLVGTGDTGSVSNTMLAGSIADSKLSTISTADKVSGAAVQVDGATDGTSITLADSDKFLVDDGGTTKYINASQLNAYTSAAVALDDVSTGDAAVTLATSAGNITIDAQGNDTDIILKGTDGSSDTTFLTIDGSAAGEATFNAGIVIADAGNIGSASDKDAIAIASDGVVTFSQAPVFPDGSIAIDDLNIDGGTDIGADLVDADEIIVDDGGGGTNRRSDLTRVKKYVYSAMSGDATASDAGAVTIANDAVESGMLNDNVISGQTALTSGLATTDELLVSDGGTLKRMDVSLILNSAADEATALAIALG